MTPVQPRLRALRATEAHVRCPISMGPLQVGGPVAECPHCGTLHDPQAWREFGGCATVGCEAQPARRTGANAGAVRISSSDISQVDLRARRLSLEIPTASGPRLVPVTKIPSRIGSGVGMDIRLVHESVLADHARIVEMGPSHVLLCTAGAVVASRDGGSATFLRLTDATEFRIGRIKIVARYERQPSINGAVPVAPIGASADGRPAPQTPPSRSQVPAPPSPPPPPPPPSPPPPPRFAPGAPPPRGSAMAASSRATTPAAPPTEPTRHSGVVPIRRLMSRHEPSRVCPYSMEQLVEGVAIAECPKCAQVLLSAAWDENGGCTTYGCDGAPDFRKDRP
jgi:hypothetical protein